MQNVLTSRATITIRHSRPERIDQFHKEKGNSEMFVCYLRERSIRDVPAARKDAYSRRLSQEPDCVSGLEVAIGAWKSCVERFDSILGLERFIL